MGDYFQSLVAPDVAADQANSEGARLLEWLIAEGIVSPDKTDCILSDSLGHRPGPHYVKATGETDPPSFLTMRSNGVGVIAKRNVYWSGQGRLELICSSCNATFELPERWAPAIGEWFDRRGSGLLACPQCGGELPVCEWQHHPPWGFSELGFQFWNWPTFTEAFLHEFERRLGSRVVYVYGKL